MTDIIDPPAPIVVPVYPPLGSPSFNQDAYSYGSGMPGVAAGLQALADNAHNNAVAANERAVAAQDAVASVNTMTAFKGAWGTLTGPLAMPATVLHNGAYWVLLQSLADVTSVQPGTNAAVWTPHILEARALAAGVDLNAVANSGSYTVTTTTNGPVGVAAGVLVVTRGGAVMLQELTDATNGAKWLRYGSNLLTSPTFSAWGRQTQDNTPGVALAGGAIDCSKDTYFTETVNGARTLAFANIPTGAYACVVEINHVSGSITLPAGSVWVAGAPPTLNTLKRHLLYFQRALTGTGGWIVSALPNSAA